MRTSFAVLAIATLVVTGCGDKKKETHKTDSQSDLLPASAHPKMTGAIFTTDSEGEQVNGNIYAVKEDVYLNGGPRKPGAAGLPDGEYFYIVVDPGCKHQLAGPTASGPYNTAGKTIEVEDGEFTELMQLAPFATTPNAGGEYQVRVTRVDNFDAEGGGCFGFLPQYSKMDNFKVRPTPPPGGPDTFCVSGSKYFDRDGDGELESPDLPVAGIVIELFPAGVTVSTGAVTTETSATGQWAFCGLEPGSYDIHEIVPEGWFQSFPPNDAPIQVTVIDHDISGLRFGNYCLVDDVIPADPEDCTQAPLIPWNQFHIDFGEGAGVDDDLLIELEGVAIYYDNNGLAGPIVYPIAFTATAGDELHVVATDTVGVCRGLPPGDIVRDCDGAVQHLTDGYSSPLCNWTGPEVFLDETVELDMPDPGPGCKAPD